MNELELIELLTRSLPSHAGVQVGPGDDCAVLDFGLPDQWVLLKTDAVVAGIHFTDAARPEQIGHKALARCLSDVAAMAGTPHSAVITLALPREFEPSSVQRLYAGLTTLAQRHRVAIVGGETTTNPDRLLLSVALVGTVPKSRCLLRSGSQAGDALWVTGELGGSLAGKHLEFEPRLEEARWLAEQFRPHAMIDLSDGLASDLRHLLRPSGAGAESSVRAIPISGAARKAARAHREPQAALRAALTDGEDFELLFTVAAAQAVPLRDAWKTVFPQLSLTCIGRVTNEPGLRLRFPDRVQEFSEHGYVHFA